MTLVDDVASTGSDAPRRTFGPRPWPFGRGRTVALIAALCFFAGVVGWWIGEPGRASFGATDVGFLDDMSRHHDGAINLNFAYLGPANDPTIGHIAREIITSQSQEVAIMNGLCRGSRSPRLARRRHRHGLDGPRDPRRQDAGDGDA